MPENLRPEEEAVLREICKQPGMFLREISDKTDISPPTVSKIVYGLERMGKVKTKRVIKARICYPTAETQQGKGV
jgi:DNA-binding MarR family transcriptional regulator